MLLGRMPRQPRGVTLVEQLVVIAIIGVLVALTLPAAYKVFDTATRLLRSSEPPTGLFVCKGPEPTQEQEVNFPFITGFLVRPGWDAVEPSDGHFDWSYIDGEVATAKRLNKKIALAVLGGPQTPSWVYEAGAREFRYVWGGDFLAGTPARIPVLWDEVYLRKWAALVAAVGKRYAGEPAVVLAHMTAATENGLEMQLPHTPTDQEQWAQLGYTPAKAIGAWRRILDAYAEAFPQVPLDVDIHPVLGSNQVAASVAAYGHDKLDRRFGVYGGWLSGKSAQQDPYHAGMFPLVQKYAPLGFTAFQMIGNETNQPERFAPGGLRAAFSQGVGWGARYFEVWRADVLNPDLQGTLSTIDQQIRSAGP